MAKNANAQWQCRVKAIAEEKWKKRVRLLWAENKDLVEKAERKKDDPANWKERFDG